MIFESTPRQRQMIGYLRKLLKISNDTYYEIIYNGWGVDSSKDLSFNAAESLIIQFKKQATDAGLYEPKNNFFDRYKSLEGRTGMATPAQLRKINIMWKFVSKQPTDELKEQALNNFIYRITGKERLNFLTQRDVSKVVKAIETMTKQRKGNKNGNSNTN